MRRMSQTVVKGAGPDHLLQAYHASSSVVSEKFQPSLGSGLLLLKPVLATNLSKRFLSRCDCYTEPLVGSLQTARRVNNISQQREGSFGKHIIIVERPARARLRQTYPVSALKRADLPVPEF
jgi:hypothetical protein